MQWRKKEDRVSIEVRERLYVPLQRTYLCNERRASSWGSLRLARAGADETTRPGERSDCCHRTCSLRVRCLAHRSPPVCCSRELLSLRGGAISAHTMVQYTIDSIYNSNKRFPVSENFCTIISLLTPTLNKFGSTYRNDFRKYVAK